MQKFKALLLTAAGVTVLLVGLLAVFPEGAAARSPVYPIDGECYSQEETCTYSKSDDDIIRRGVRYCYYGNIDCPPCTPCGPRPN